MNTTSIEWCRTYQTHTRFTEGFTVNPVRFLPHGSTRTVTICVKCSSGCKNCYSEQINNRFWPKDAGPFPGFTVQALTVGEFVLDEEKLEQVLHCKKSGRIFWGDMTDLFGDWVKDEWLDRIFDVCLHTPHMVHMFLTKRADRMQKYGPPTAPNIWLGVSVENQEQADARIPLLLRTPTHVRFISAEPLLGDIKIPFFTTLDWVIAGAESGPHARPMNEDWVRSLRDYCAEYIIGFFYKQCLDERGHKVSTPLLDGVRYTQFPALRNPTHPTFYGSKRRIASSGELRGQCWGRGRQWHSPHP
jgi:protein gp37